MSGGRRRHDSGRITGAARQTARPSGRRGRKGRQAGSGAADHSDAPPKQGVDAGVQLFELEDGRIVTLSTELRAVNFPGAMRGRLIRPFTAAHFNLWERGWERFIDLMRREDSLHKVKINRAFWSDRTNSGTELGAAGTPERVSLANRYFTQIYERASLNSSNFIDYDQSLILSKETHKWGVAPFHYIDFST